MLEPVFLNSAMEFAAWIVSIGAVFFAVWVKALVTIAPTLIENERLGDIPEMLK